MIRIEETPFQRKKHNKLKTVIIHSGSNDASSCVSPDEIAKSLIQCTGNITWRNLHVQVILSSVLPHLKCKKTSVVEGKDENMIIADINMAIRQYTFSCRSLTEYISHANCKN